MLEQQDAIEQESGFPSPDACEHVVVSELAAGDEQIGSLVQNAAVGMNIAAVVPVCATDGLGARWHRAEPEIVAANGREDMIGVRLGGRIAHIAQWAGRD